MLAMGIPRLLAFLRRHATRFELQPLDPSSTAARDNATVNQGWSVDHRPRSVLDSAVRHDSEASGCPGQSDKDSASCSSPSIDRLEKHVVVDGPGLAYHAYYKTLARRCHCRNALDAMPPYEDVIAIALEWLVTIQKYGFTLCAIYFDGYLPERKIQVRLLRLQESLKELSSFRSLYETKDEFAARDHSVKSHILASNLFSTSHIPANLTLLPASPFLVPSIIEALRNSDFSELTKVIPGEADEFCAAYLRDHGGIVLTGDSDLLIHDLGANGNVIFFKDLEIVEKDGGHRLRGEIYHPTTISSRLNLKSLLPLAFSLQEDYQRGLNACLQEARFIQNARLLTLDIFAAEYTEPQLEGSSFYDTIARLDPRISELVCQLLQCKSNSTNNQEYQNEEKNLDIYLPFLVEDPTRTSAWAVGLPVRQLGYSALCQCAHRTSSTSSSTEPRSEATESHERFQKFVITEHWRRGNRIAGTVVRPLSETVLKHGPGWGRTMTDLETLWTICKDAAFDGMDAGLIWRLIGVGVVCRVLGEQGRGLPERMVLDAVVRGVVLGVNWNHVHFGAMVQAALYSLRTVKQLLDVVEGTNDDYRTRKEWQAQRKLHDLVNTMPSISELFPKELADVEEDTMNAILDKLYSMLDIQPEEPSERVTEPSTKKKRKRKQKGDRATTVSRSQNSSSNMYSLLSEN